MKRRLIIFLCLVFIFNSLFGIQEAEAIGPLPIFAAIGAVIGVGTIAKLLGVNIEDVVVRGLTTFIALVIKWISFVFFYILWLINNSILAPVIDLISQINPFAENGPILIIWNIFKNFAYILLVFSALFAGFQWLFGEDATAKRLIFAIILVALIINFTFVLIKELFFIVDSLEKGLTGGTSKRIGTIIAASLWQKDPFGEIEKTFSSFNTSTSNETSAAISNNLAMSFAYLFLVVFEMLIFIILVIVAALFFARYILLLFYAGISPLALATAVIPESKGVLAEFTRGLRQYGNWINSLFKWLLIVPFFVFLVILGNIIQYNTFQQLQGLSGFSGLIEFAMILFFMAAWYIISLIIAVRVSGIFGATAKFAAFGILGGLGIFAARNLMSLASGQVGGFLQSTGGLVQERVGVGGTFGWRSWVSQRVGRGVEEIGGKLIERRYKTEAEAVRTRINTLEEQLRKETNPQRIQSFTSEIVNIIDRYKNVPYVLKTVSEDIGRMNINAFEKLARDPKALPILAGPDAPKEVRDKIIDQIEKLPRRTIRDIFNDPKLLDTYTKFSAEVFSKFIEKAGKELNDENVLDILSNDNLRNYFQNLPSDHPLRRTLNRVSNNLFEGLISRNVDEVSLALINLSSDAWKKTKEIDKILQNYNLNPTQALFRAIAIAEKPEIIINSLMGKLKGDPLRVALSKLTDPEIEDLSRKLTPQLKNKLETIILEETT